ncbi:MAG: hypothetical protein HQ500_05475 [Flavobacteriales bacterium]|nr:hypothetical protein [Flavobacteriales bacterium]
MKYCILFSICLIFTACSAKLLVPTQADSERGSSRYDGLTLAELQYGKTTYQSYCDRCHPLKNPEKFTAMEWEKIVPVMVARVNKKESKMNEKDHDQVLKYLTTMSKRV